MAAALRVTEDADQGAPGLAPVSAALAPVAPPVAPSPQAPGAVRPVRGYVADAPETDVPGIIDTPTVHPAPRRRTSARPTPTHPGGRCAPPARPSTAVQRVAVRVARPRPVTALAARAHALAIVVLSTLTVVFGLALLGESASAGDPVPDRTSVVRVGTGETVWDVAERVAPGSDTSSVVDRIRDLNNLPGDGAPGGAVQSGQQLIVPDGR